MSHGAGALAAYTSSQLGIVMKSKNTGPALLSS
jgi:hypothetical protein